MCVCVCVLDAAKLLNPSRHLCQQSLRVSRIYECAA